MTLAVSCKDYISEKEICVAASTGRLGCDDPRKEKREYVRDVFTGDVCTNKADFFKADEEIRNLVKEVIQLKSDLKKCRNRP